MNIGCLTIGILHLMTRLSKDVKGLNEAGFYLLELGCSITQMKLLASFLIDLIYRYKAESI